MMQKLQQQWGFSLMEVVIATAIFVTATAAVADIFVRTNRAQRKTQGITTTAADARFAIESLARTARLGTVDYDYYLNGTITDTGEGTLALRAAGGTPVKFSRQTTICPDGASFGCLAVCLLETCVDATSDWSVITPQGVDVTLLNFLIYPTSTPFTANATLNGPDTHPSVTIIMQSENIVAIDDDKKNFDIQTTVSTRIYQR